MSPRARHRPGRPSAAEAALRTLVAAGLTIDAYVHLQLAGGYQAAAPGGIGEGTLFRIEAGAAIAVAAAILLRAGRVPTVLAFLVPATALGAVLLYRYVDVPAIGPLPAMYEPVWFFQKSLSALAEAAAAAAASGLLLQGSAARRHPQTDIQPRLAAIPERGR